VWRMGSIIGPGFPNVNTKIAHIFAKLARLTTQKANNHEQINHIQRHWTTAAEQRPSRLVG